MYPTKSREGPLKKKVNRRINPSRRRRQVSGLNLSDGLKFISSLLLPLALGVFTVVITFEQQKTTRHQRDEDRLAFQLQREEDRNSSRLQREEDRDASRLQREEDRTASQLQRDQDKYLNEERYKNELIDTYIKEMGQLLANNSGSFTSNSITATLARVKTLNIFRQLDPQRNIRIIRFLHEAGQLNYLANSSSLDLSSAELRNINFSYSTINKKKLETLSLAGAILSNATFVRVQMEHLNFSEAQLDDSDFFWTRTDNVDYSFSQLDNANFSFSNLSNINFSNSKLKNANFSFSDLLNTSLSSSEMKNTNVSFAKLDTVKFFSTELGNIDFSSTRLDHIEFWGASLKHINFSSNLFTDIKFSSASLSNVNFSYSWLFNAKFDNTTLHNTNFSSTILVSASFSEAKVSDTDFQQVSCVEANFFLATLSNSNFTGANAKRASFQGSDLPSVSFFGTNLYMSDFRSTKVTESQLQSALSIQDAILPNQTLADDPNLINNGQADCNVSLNESWTLTTGNITIARSNMTTRNCYFALTSYDTGATMSQRVDLLKKWDSKSWPKSQAVLRANMSIGVSIQLKGINSSGNILDHTHFNFPRSNTTLVLDEIMQEFEVVIEFSALANRSNSENYWCDDIKLFIIYGTYSDFLRVIPEIPVNARWAQNGVTVAGGYGGSATNRLMNPYGLFVDDDQTIVIADYLNHRIVQWKMGDTNGKVVAGGNGKGRRLDQLYYPSDVLIDKETDSLIICDRGNRRVARWSRLSGTKQGEILIDNIDCWGLAMDDQRYLYVSDWQKDEVRRYQIGNKNGTLVAGGNGKGAGLNQLNFPTYILVDRQQTVYVSDSSNNRVMKWNKGATEGIVVAGGQGKGNALTQLDGPHGLFVDTFGTLYVAEAFNYRVIRWPKGAKQGTVIVGGNGKGSEPNQLSYLKGLSFDRQGNLYVADMNNNRVQRFLIR
ncbi:unnamed protein product [Rotaria socialis]|uniref:Uncharacterized protein n=1 Tax=Rotaria socialis TaxID=392032 RepID=A0A820CCW1_9BILA|nr:unnamed protein product [Rotaria socialis]